jgi:hypothetical protein
MRTRNNTASQMLYASKAAKAVILGDVARERAYVNSVHVPFGATHMAIHEASHAVMGTVVNAPKVRFTEIIPRVRARQFFAGYTEYETAGVKLTGHDYYRLALSTVAPEAMLIHLGIFDDDAKRTINHDTVTVDELYFGLHDSKCVTVRPSEFRPLLLSWAAEIMPSVIDAIAETARQLDVKKRLSGDEVQVIVDRFPQAAFTDVVKTFIGRD